MHKRKLFGCTLLVAGTAIGAGMVALPITTGVTGTLPAILILLGCFSFMLLNLLILLEAAFYCEVPEANIISIVQTHLGIPGAILAWISYVLLLYAVIAAYISGGAELISHAMHASQMLFSEALTAIIFTLLFGSIIYLKASKIDLFNRLLMTFLILSFLLLTILVGKHAQLDLTKGGTPNYVWSAIPVVVLAFTSHLIVPSIKTYLQNDVKAIKSALIYGSLTILGCYLLWDLILIAALPSSGNFSLLAIAQSPDPIVAIGNSLTNYLNMTSVGINLLVFSFFALVTSFLGTSLSLVDFLADGLKIHKTPRGRLLLIGLTLIPPLFFALVYPNGFIVALGYAGFFVAILFCILPALVTWKARYLEKLTTPYRVSGGKTTLIITLVGGILIMCLHAANSFNLLPNPTA